MADDISPEGYRMTKRQRAEYALFVEAARAFDWDLRYAVSTGRVIPAEWREAFAAEPDRRERVTIRLDADAVAFFRKFGRGWQASLNRVVRAYVKARLAGLLEPPEFTGGSGEVPPRPGELPKPETAEALMDEVEAVRRELGLGE